MSVHFWPPGHSPTFAGSHAWVSEVDEGHAPDPEGASQRIDEL
jgi:hypothetical protein